MKSTLTKLLPTVSRKNNFGLNNSIDGAFSIAVSGNNKYLAVGIEDGSIAIFDIQSREQVLAFKARSSRNKYIFLNIFFLFDSGLLPSFYP